MPKQSITSIYLNALKVIIGLLFVVPFGVSATTTVPFVLFDYGGDQWGSEASYYANNWNLYDLTDTLIQGSVGSAIDPCFIDLTGVPANTYYIRCEDFTSEIEYLSDNFVWTGSSILGDFSTKIITITPYDKQTLATTSESLYEFVVGVTGYIDSVDSTSKQKVDITLYNKNCSGVAVTAINAFPSFDDSYACTRLVNFGITGSGYFEASTTIEVAWFGEWDLRADIDIGDYCLGNYCVANKSFSATSTIFTLGEPNKVDLLDEYSADLFDDLATSTCAIGNFDTLGCLQYILLPHKADFVDFFDEMKDGALSYFPLGFVTDFVSVLATSTQASFLGISATVPPGIPGTGSHIQIGISSTTLDYVYGATVGQFLNESAPDTRTLYEITYEYWEIICYIALLFYLIARILGSIIVPQLGGVDYEVRRSRIGAYTTERRAFSDSLRVMKTYKESNLPRK